MLTCVSLRLSEAENSARSAIDRYCFCRKRRSSDSSCCVVNGVRGFRSLRCLRSCIAQPFRMRVCACVTAAAAAGCGGGGAVESENEQRRGLHVSHIDRQLLTLATSQYQWTLRYQSLLIIAQLLDALPPGHWS